MTTTSHVFTFLSGICLFISLEFPLLTNIYVYSISSVIQCGFSRHIRKITTVFDRKTFQHKSIVFITLFHIFDYIEIEAREKNEERKNWIDTKHLRMWLIPCAFAARWQKKKKKQNRQIQMHRTRFTFAFAFAFDFDNSLFIFLLFQNLWAPAKMNRTSSAVCIRKMAIAISYWKFSILK